MGREVTLSLGSIIAGSAALTFSLVAHIVSFSFHRHLWERNGTIPSSSSAAFYKGFDVQVLHNLRPRSQFQ
jgi:hypothetical protein